MSKAYLVEESVAVLGSAKIMARIFSMAVDPSGEWQRVASEVMRKSNEVVCDMLNGHGPFRDVEMKSTQALNLLVGESAVGIDPTPRQRVQMEVAAHGWPGGAVSPSDGGGTLRRMVEMFRRWRSNNQQASN